MNRLSLIGGVVIGASVVYLFDPSQGKRRRRRLAKRVGVVVDTLRPGPGSGRNGAKSDEWEAPMATVNIDIDQGTVTLRGAFPPSDAPPGRTWAHRGLNRARGHAAARRGFGESDQG